jgi:hypothetical protein
MRTSLSHVASPTASLRGVVANLGPGVCDVNGRWDFAD